MPPRDSWQGTFLVALVLCLVCSAIVSTAAVVLKDKQDANKALDKKKNVLLAAGLCEKSATAAEIDAKFDEVIVRKFLDLDTGEAFAVDAEDLPIDPVTYDAKKAAKDPDQQRPVEPEGALPGIADREPYAEFYEIQEGGELQGYVLPIYGKGLWSTLYGFIALEADKETVKGITYYEHKETPGLGGEVDNPNWQALWPGKKVYDESGEVDLGVVKGKAAADDAYGVDGLSGATITSKGVDNMVKYWLGPTAFGKHLAQH